MKNTPVNFGHLMDKRDRLSDADQVLRDRKIARLTTKLQRTFESVERIQGKIARLLTRCQS